MYTELHGEEKREEGDRDDQEEKTGNQKEREIQPVISSLGVLHSPEHTKRFTDLGREEKGEGGHRPPGGEKEESKGGESSQASDLTPK